jgi:hypothetical protein
MLTRLKLTRGEGQLVEPSSHPSRRKHIPSPQVSRRHSPGMAHEESHEHVPAEDEDLRKVVMEMREMMKILIERNTRFQVKAPTLQSIRETVVIKLQMEMEGMVLLYHPLLHLILLLILPIQDLFRILQRDMVKLLCKFLH